MAKKKTSGKTKSFSEAIGLQYIFNNTITDFFLGLALLVVAVVMMLAMISFLSTGGEFRFSCLPDSLLRGDGGFPADECLSRESLEVVLLHDGGDDLVIRHLRQVPHSYLR